MRQLPSKFRVYASKVIASPSLNLSDEQFNLFLSKLALKHSFKMSSPADDRPKDVIFRCILGRLSGEVQYKIIEDFCNFPGVSSDNEIQELLNTLHGEYSSFASDSLSNTSLIQTTKHWLDNYPDAKKQYDSALSKVEKGLYERNTLDDMRLALELLTKKMLNNSRSLENNISDIGSELSKRRVPVEFRNMLTTIIKYYTNYQNAHVKHSDSVDKCEVEFVVELTSAIMKYLITVFNEAPSEQE